MRIWTRGFVGGLCIFPTGDVLLMTKKQIMQAWAKSSAESRLPTQVRRKDGRQTLVNWLQYDYQLTPEYQISMDDETNMIENKASQTTMLWTSRFTNRLRLLRSKSPVAVAAPVEQEPCKEDKEECSKGRACASR